jgi:hypothetical protein
VKKRLEDYLGGDSKELNYLLESKSQKNAFDFLMTSKKGKSFRTDGNSNENFYAFGQYLFSPYDGEIVSLVDGVKENIMGEMNSFHKARSSKPHLHFHVQNTENMNDAEGVKCYFDKITVDGQLKTDYSPIKNERLIQN